LKTLTAFSTVMGWRIGCAGPTGSARTTRASASR
jgi:hypothetical protein